MTVLVSRPRHDKATNYLYYWSESVIDAVKVRRIRLADLSGDKAISSVFKGYFEKIKPSFLFLNGHGSAESIFGHNDLKLISVSDDLARFANCIFYSRSCDSGAILGPELIKAGARGFIGYERELIVSFMPEYITRPLRDPLAKLFLEPSNLVPLSIVKGNTVGEAYRKTQAAMLTNLRKMLSSGASYQERYHSVFLWSNIKHQVILGNPESRA